MLKDPAIINRLARFIPVFDWGRRYDRDALGNDLVATVIVTIMLIPQSLAYALLAGLPAETGIYASIAPIVLYAIFGTSRALAVGPVAVVSLMTAAAIGNLAEPGSPELLLAAITLAFLSGVFLILLGVLRLGFLANFLSHPVVAGFITASGILIAMSQLSHILGISAGGDTLPKQVASLLEHLGEINWITLALGASATAFLFWVRKGLMPLLLSTGMKPKLAGVLAKAASGALEMIDHIEVRNLAAAIDEIKAQGFVTIGLDSEGPEPIEAGLSGDRIALVLGAEGKGLRQKTRETVDVLVRLDMPGAIKSLNVSNATAIALYAAQQHLIKRNPA